MQSRIWRKQRQQAVADLKEKLEQAQQDMLDAREQGAKEALGEAEAALAAALASGNEEAIAAAERLCKAASREHKQRCIRWHAIHTVT
jgi:hypothetical protein